MSFFIGLISVLFLSGVGLLTLRIINIKNTKFIDIVGYSLPLGIGFVSFQLFILSMLNLKWTLEAILLPWLVIFFIFLLLNKEKKIRINLTKPKISFSHLVLLGLVLVQMFFVLVESQLRPLITWDGWATWLFRSRMFFIDGGVLGNVQVFYDMDYPVFLSIAESVVYFFLNRIDDRVVLLFYPAVYVSIFVLIYSFLRTRVGNYYALIFGFMFISLQIVVRHAGRFDAGQADLPLSLFFLSASIALVNYIKTNNFKYLLITFLISGFSTQIKSEGLPFALVIGLISNVFILKLKSYKYLFLNLVWICPIVIWELYKVGHAFPASFHFTKGIYVYFERLPQIFIGISKELYVLRHWSILWLLFLYALFIGFTNKRVFYKESIVLLLVAVLQMLSYIFIFLITPHKLDVYIPNVIDRLLLHISPIIILVIALIYSRVKINK